jgi:hypothetical protein
VKAKLVVLGDDGPAAFVVQHRVVRRVGMNVALIATDRPRSDLFQLLAAVLDSAVVAALLDLGPQLKILDGAATPNQELVVGQRLIAFRNAGDAAVNDRPTRRVAFPAAEVLAIE